MEDDLAKHQQTVGRYMLFGQIGAGGMGAVHLGRRIGPAGFSRLVAIKRLHPHLAKDRELVNSFLDEARIAARVSHPNVVSIDDVVLSGNEVLLVMEYVKGQSLSFLASAERKAGRSVPPRIVAAIANDMLHGLQAAHEARDERGRLLGVIHRDVSPQNVLLGVDGIARVLDFGIAKALGRLQTTQKGAVKGKLAYMAPERLSDREPTTSVDVYAAAIVIWELLAGERYFEGPSSEALIPIVLEATYKHLRAPALAPVDLVLERALRREPEQRHKSCKELAADLERVLTAASRDEISAWVQRIAGDELAMSEALVADIECSSTPSPAPLSQGSRTMTSRVSPEEAVPPTRPDPPSTSREPPPTRPDRAPRQPDTSTQLTSEATVSDVRRAAAPESPKPKLARNVVLASLAVGIAVVIAAGARAGLSLARSESPAIQNATAAPASARAPESVLPATSSSTSASTSVGSATTASITTPPPGIATRGDEHPHAPKGGGRTANPIPSASASASPRPAPLPDAPTDRK